MKAIEKKIIETIRAKESKTLSCRDSVVFAGSEIKVYLWNSCIFSINKNGVFTFSFCNWNTNTTKSRINVLLQTFCDAKVIQKNYKLFVTAPWIDGKIEINAYDSFKIKRNEAGEFYITCVK